MMKNIKELFASLESRIYTLAARMRVRRKAHAIDISKAEIPALIVDVRSRRLDRAN